MPCQVDLKTLDSQACRGRFCTGFSARRRSRRRFWRSRCLWVAAATMTMALTRPWRGRISSDRNRGIRRGAIRRGAIRRRRSAEDGGGAADFGEEAEAPTAPAPPAQSRDSRAWAGGDWARACSLLATSTKENVAVFASQFAKSQACPEQLRGAGRTAPGEKAPAGQAHRGDRRSLEDGRGFVLYRDAGGTEFAFPVLGRARPGKSPPSWDQASVAEIGYARPKIA